MSVIDCDVSVPAARPWLSRVIYFGWSTILVGAIAMAATFPGRSHGLGLVIEPLLQDMREALVSANDPQGREFYSVLNFWGTLIGAFFCVPVGWLFDRFDRRWILATNLLLLGAAVQWMSRVVTWEQLFVALIFTRGLGQSALSVVSITIVAKSFRAAQLGLAMGWYAILAAPMYLMLKQGVGWGMAPTEMPTTVFWFFDTVGLGLTWRQMWGDIGLVLMLLAVTAFLLPRKPAIEIAQSTEASSSVSGSNVWQALATPAFWVFSLTVSFWGMISSGVFQFNQSIFEELHFFEETQQNRALYINVFSMIGIVTLGAHFLFGWLVNRVRLTYLLTACLLPTAISLYLLPRATQPWHAYVYGVFVGIASGAVTVLFFATWGRLYGRRDLGRIQAVAQMLTVFASAAGPWVVAYIKNETKTYTLFFYIMAAAVAVMAVLAFFTPLPPQTPAQPRERR